MPVARTIARRHRFAVGTSVTYLVALAVVVFWPEHVDAWAAARYPRLVRHAPPLFPFGVDATLNVILFVPFGVLLHRVLPRRLLSAIGLAWATSLLVEIAQGLFLPGRTSSALDVAANTVGAILGYAAMRIVAWRRRPTARATSPDATDARSTSSAKEEPFRSADAR